MWQIGIGPTRNGKVNITNFATMHYRSNKRIKKSQRNVEHTNWHNI